jgi:hypothetical protein
MSDTLSPGIVPPDAPNAPNAPAPSGPAIPWAYPTPSTKEGPFIEKPEAP